MAKGKLPPQFLKGKAKAKPAGGKMPMEEKDMMMSGMPMKGKMSKKMPKH